MISVFQDEQVLQAVSLDKDPFKKPRGGPSKEWLQALENLEPRTLSVPEPHEQEAAVDEILTTLETEPPEPSPELVAQTEHALESIHRSIPDAKQFVAGSFQAYVPAWKRLLSKSKRAPSKKVLRWLEIGFVPKFIGTAAAPTKNVEEVRNMLRRVMRSDQVERYLQNQRPGPVEFQNHKSFYDHWDFSSEEVKNLLLVRAGSLLSKGAPKPVIVHPFGVALTAGKRRLICDAETLNLFLENFPFQYEKLRDVLAYTQKGSFMVTWDLKAGYYHVPIHPAYRKYFGFKIGDRYGVYNVLCFGLSEACYAFTKIAQEPLIELRSRGVPVSGYIDDGHTAARTYGQAIRQGFLAVRLLATVGAFFGLPKCIPHPVQELKWLGFLLDTLSESFKVAPSKMEKIKDALREMIARPTTSARGLASLAGQLVALSPAILPALLFTRTIFQALAGNESWDNIFPSPQSVRRAAIMWLNNIDAWNGRSWWPQRVSITLRIDASSVGYGGFIRAAHLPCLEVAGSFEPAESQLSSAAREIIGYVRAIKIVAEKMPRELRGSAILLLGDSQAAIGALRKFASPSAPIHEQLTHLFELCSSGSFDTIPRWTPRDQLSDADDLSRRPDASDWGLTPDQVNQIMSHFYVQQIDLDVFASDIHHVVDKFISGFFVPGCTAVHALACNWRGFIPSKATIWVFPPLKALSVALSTIERNRIDAIIIMPSRTASNEWIQVHQLTGHVSGPFHIPRQAHKCRPSLRVPSSTVNPILMGLSAFFVKYPGDSPSNSMFSYPISSTLLLRLRILGTLSNFSSVPSPSLFRPSFLALPLHAELLICESCAAFPLQRVRLASEHFARESAEHSQ
jgi:hypothetical protein